MGAGESLVSPTSVGIHFVECIVASGGNVDILLERWECFPQTYVIEMP